MVVGDDEETLLSIQGSTWSSLMWYTFSWVVTATSASGLCGKPSTVMWVIPL